MGSRDRPSHSNNPIEIEIEIELGIEACRLRLRFRRRFRFQFRGFSGERGIVPRIPTILSKSRIFVGSRHRPSLPTILSKSKSNSGSKPADQSSDFDSDFDFDFEDPSGIAASSLASRPPNRSLSSPIGVGGSLPGVAQISRESARSLRAGRSAGDPDKIPHLLLDSC